MNISAVSFCGQPYNYSAIDKYVSRSAQPEKEDFVWLKEQGITDVFNFRTMYVSGLDFDEGKTVKELGMKYHSIPSITSKPNEETVLTERVCMRLYTRCLIIWVIWQIIKQNG